MEAFIKTANFGIGTFLVAKEAVENTFNFAGEKIDSVIEKGAAEQGDFATNSRQLVTDFSNGVADVQGKIETFISDVQAQLDK